MHLAWMIDSKDILLADEIGAGANGIVYRATWNDMQVSDRVISLRVFFIVVLLYAQYKLTIRLL